MYNTSNNPNPNLKRFLNAFPPQELWRFFVERSRYAYASELLHYLYYYATDLPSVEIQQTSDEQIATYFSGMSLQEIVSKPKTPFKQQRLRHFIEVYRLQDQNFIQSIQKHQGWRGFEEAEPGYLVQMTEGFCFILESLLTQKSFNIAFIKELHKKCTRGVVNMLPSNRPGQFRNNSAGWHMSLKIDSLLGIRQNLNYLKSIEQQYGDPKLFIRNDTSSTVFGEFTMIDIDDAARFLQQSLLATEYPIYCTTPDSKNFLNKVGKQLILELEASLRVAQTKIQRLSAVFTYLKKTVLHHPFADGVGRTYSMLLLQYLLIREGFLPFIITNSNMIPGMSVEDMVDEYLRGEEEMECILRDANFINTQAFASPNSDSNALLSQATAKERILFEQSQTLYQKTKQQCLKALEDSITPNKALADQIDQEGYTPLHQAARRGHAATVRYWISEGANLNMLTDARCLEPHMTAIELARYGGHESIVLLLHNARVAILPTVNPLEEEKKQVSAPRLSFFSLAIKSLGDSGCLFSEGVNPYGFL